MHSSLLTSPKLWLSPAMAPAAAPGPAQAAVCGRGYIEERGENMFPDLFKITAAKLDMDRSYLNFGLIS